MNETIELKDCPFCGLDEIKLEEEANGYWRVRCLYCFARGGKRETKERAAAAWNRRVPPDTPQDGDDSGNPAMLALAIADALQEAGHEQATEMMRAIDAKTRGLLDELERVKGERYKLAYALKRWGINDRFIADSRPIFDLADSILADEPAPDGDAGSTVTLREGEVYFNGQVMSVDAFLAIMAAREAEQDTPGDARGELGARLIAWAADEDNVIVGDFVEYCVLCREEREPHADDCMYTAAKRIQEITNV